jgi:hypothetical protein
MVGWWELLRRAAIPLMIYWKLIRGKTDVGLFAELPARDWAHLFSVRSPGFASPFGKGED